MNANVEVARELLAAGGDLLLGLPRIAWSLAACTARRKEFEALPHDPVPGPLAAQPPDRQLRRLVLSCGDASGEGHALRLLDALRRRHPDLQVAGFGGARLAAAGMEVWEPLADLNVMGFKDVLSRISYFLGCVRRFAREMAQNPPDAVLLIDYPGLNRRLLRIARRAGVTTIDYGVPQLWAWAPWRVRDFRRADRLLTILPFEGAWLRRRGATPQYLGHPLGDTLANHHAREAEPPAELNEPGPWVGILPGSRRREIRANLPAMLAAAELLRDRRPETRFVLPHLRESVWPLLDEHLARSGLEVVRAPGSYHRVLARLSSAWVSSGTAQLEVAAHGVPPVLVYGLTSRSAEWFRRWLLAVPRIGLLNLMAGREVAPEHVKQQLDPDALACSLERLLEGPERAKSLETIATLRPHFAAGAAERAVRVLEEAAGRARTGNNPGTTA